MFENLFGKITKIGENSNRDTLLVEDGNQKVVVKKSQTPDENIRTELVNLCMAHGVAGVPKLLGVESNDQGGIAFSREYISGRVLDTHEKITDPKKIKQLTQIVDNLHERGISYLDLHQYNIVDNGEQIYLVDLGNWVNIDSVSDDRRIEADMEKLKRIIRR